MRQQSRLKTKVNDIHIFNDSNQIFEMNPITEGIAASAVEGILALVAVQTGFADRTAGLAFDPAFDLAFDPAFDPALAAAVRNSVDILLAALAAGYYSLAVG